MDIEDLENPNYVKAKMPEALKLIVSECVNELHLSDLQDLINELGVMDTDEDSFRGNFCDRFDLGEYIYDAFDLYDIDVEDVLNDILSQRIKVAREEG